MKLKRILALWLLCMLLFSLCACGEKPVSAAVFRIATPAEPDSLNPFCTEGGLTEEFFLLCYDSLWRRDENGETVSDIAESWSLSSDSLTWTIRLREDVTFSDGEPLTAEDVMFSYELLRHTDTLYSAYFEGISAIRCPDDYTVVIVTDYVKGDMTENPAPILPKHIWSAYEFDPTAFDNAAMIGSGPFVYEAGSTEEGWRFRARSDYGGQTPQVGEVFFVAYATETGAARAIAAGEVDASFGLTDVQLTTLESVPGVQLLQTILPGAECEALVFNTREDRLFEDGTMRHILEQCMDRAWFLAMSAGSTGQTGSTFASPGTDWFLEGLAVTEYDLTAAQNALIAAGYRDTDEDGILESVKTEEELSFVLYSSSQDTWAATAAAILTEALETVGISVKWVKTDDDISSVCTEKADWDACMFAWRSSEDATIAASEFYDTVGGLSGWVSPSFESGLEQLRTAMDVADIHTQGKSLQQLAYDDCPCVVLAYAADVQAIRSDLWTGYEDIGARTGGLFATGERNIYMLVRETDK